MKNRLKSVMGFTLIELMVVIVILGILSAVIAPRIPQFVIKAKEGRTKGNLATMRSVINIYYADNDGMYPKGTDGQAIGASFTPKYMKKIPLAGMPPYHEAVDTGRLGTDGAADEWWYQNDETANNWGEIKLNCAGHVDSGGVGWSTY
jgi:general secretion pathway protein G